MEQGRDFDFSCSPIVSYTAMRMQIAAAAIKSLELFSLDMSNYFPSDVLKPEYSLWLKDSVCYMEWFQLEYPYVKIKPSSIGKYVLQTINGMQGRKDAGCSWYLLLQDIIHNFGL